jgi:hypothetical protein
MASADLQSSSKIGSTEQGNFCLRPDRLITSHPPSLWSDSTVLDSLFTFSVSKDPLEPRPTDSSWISAELAAIRTGNVDQSDPDLGKHYFRFSFSSIV